MLKIFNQTKIKTLGALICASFLLSACGSGGSDNNTQAQQSQATQDAQTTANAKIIVGATPEPHGTMLKEVQEVLSKNGVDLEIKEFTDYVTPNVALDDGSLDANFMQHEPYLKEFNKEKGTNLVKIVSIHLEPMGVYSHKIKNLSELSEGAVISVPNDPSNESRALRILEKQGLLTFPADKELITPNDIIENPKKLQIKEIDGPQLARTLDEVSASVINTNFALTAGLNPLKDAIAIEDKDSPYANILVVKQGRENDENIKKLAEALTSEDMRKFIEETYKGAILPSF